MTDFYITEAFFYIYETVAVCYNPVKGVIKMSFADNRQYIEDKFYKAKYDNSTGIPSETIRTELHKMIDAKEENEPEQLFRARLYAYVLDNARLSMNTKTPFPIMIDFGIDYSYFASQPVYSDVTYRRRDIAFQKYMPEDAIIRENWERCGLASMWNDFWHTVPDWNNVIKYGFSGILKNAEDKKKSLLDCGIYEDKQIHFLDSVIISFKAMIRTMERMYEYSLKFDMSEFSECLKNITYNPPKTLYEVLQLQVLFLYFEELGLERARSLGPVDRLWYPFYKSDLECGKYTLEEIKEYLRFFFIHYTASKRFAQQPMCLGGRNENGKTFVNDLTYLILDVYDEMNIYDPKIHFRYHKGIDDKIMLKILDMIRRGNSSLCILNDETVFEGYRRMGIPMHDAENYVPLGCYEPIIMGKEEAEIGAVWMSFAKILELCIYDGYDKINDIRLLPEIKGDISTFDGFFDKFISYLDFCIDYSIKNVEMQGDICTDCNPSPIYSATFTSCMEKAADIHEYSADYNNLSVKLYALATTVDSLVMLKKYVYDKKRITPEEISKVMADNWNGFEELRASVLRDSERYGNNLELPDKIMLEIINHLREKYAYKKLRRGGVLRLGTDSINKCISCGKLTGATFDGRLCGEPLSKNLRSVDGYDKKGITAHIQSLLKIDAADFIDSATFDFILHPSAVSGEDGLCAFKGLTDSYFKNGGFALQGNILNAEMLKKAKENPDKYKTLQIRVCGWNEYFVRLSKEMQDTFITQCSEK